MAQAKQQLKFEEIHALGTETIAKRADNENNGDRRRTNFDFLSSADIVEQS